MMQSVMKYMKSGKKPKEAIAMALSDKRMKKMAKGGVVDHNEPSDMAVVGGGLPQDESMAEMAEEGADDGMRGLGELMEDGDMDPQAVANPSSLAQAFMRYAMGGLVEAGPAQDEMLHGNQPEAVLSEDAKKALEMKKKARMYGRYSPKA